MTSADFLRFNNTLPHCLFLWESFIPLAGNPRKISPGKRTHFHPMQPPHLPDGVRAVSDFALFGKLVPSKSALYAVPVRRFGTLPKASFRFHLTMDTLAFD